MKSFKLILRWILFFFVLALYYFIGLALIESRMSPVVGFDNGITDFLMILALMSPFIVIKNLFKWLCPLKRSVYLRSVMGGSIIIGMGYHLIEIVHEKILDTSYAPYYGFALFIAISLFVIKDKKQEKLEFSEI